MYILMVIHIYVYTYIYIYIYIHIHIYIHTRTGLTIILTACVSTIMFGCGIPFGDHLLTLERYRGD